MSRSTKVPVWAQSAEKLSVWEQRCMCWDIWQTQKCHFKSVFMFYRNTKSECFSLSEAHYSDVFFFNLVQRNAKFALVWHMQYILNCLKIQKLSLKLYFISYWTYQSCTSCDWHVYLRVHRLGISPSVVTINWCLVWWLVGLTNRLSSDMKLKMYLWFYFKM